MWLLIDSQSLIPIFLWISIYFCTDFFTCEKKKSGITWITDHSFIFRSPENLNVMTSDRLWNYNNYCLLQSQTLRLLKITAPTALIPIPKWKAHLIFLPTKITRILFLKDSSVSDVRWQFFRLCYYKCVHFHENMWTILPTSVGTAYLHDGNNSYANGNYIFQYLKVILCSEFWIKRNLTMCSTCGVLNILAINEINTRWMLKCIFNLEVFMVKGKSKEHMLNMLNSFDFYWVKEIWVKDTLVTTRDTYLNINILSNRERLLIVKVCIFNPMPKIAWGLLHCIILKNIFK